MSEPCSDELYDDVTTLFEHLWSRVLKQRVIDATENLSKAVAVEIITRLVGTFLDTFPFHDRLKLHPDVKDNEQAHAARLRGNGHFAANVREYIKSIECYNQSIAYSAKGSEARALAYSNRSAVCFKLYQFKDCLENIRLARASTNCPDHLLAKLQKREQRAKHCIEQEVRMQLTKVEHTPGKYRPRETANLPLELKRPAHDKVPHLARCVELRRNGDFGRHLVVTGMVEAGEVLLVEKPYASVLQNEGQYIRCAFCHNADMNTLIPCEGCTVAMYCSNECLEKAHQQYHRYECGVLRDCWRMAGELHRGILGLRTVATAIASFEQDLEGWQEHLNALDDTAVHALTVDWSKATARDIYDTVHVLATNQQRRDRKNLTKFIFLVSIVHRLLLERTELGAVCEASPAKGKLLYSLLLRHWQSSIINGRNVHHVVHEDVEVEDDMSGDYYFTRDVETEKNYINLAEVTHARACYPLLSMLNHSCVPNVAPIYLLDGRCAIVAIRPIAAREQLFDCYGMTTPKYCRGVIKDFFRQSYKFQCRCAACKMNGSFYTTAADESILLMIKCLSLSDELRKRYLVSAMNQCERHYPPHQLTHLQQKLVDMLRWMYSYSMDDNRICVGVDVELTFSRR